MALLFVLSLIQIGLLFVGISVDMDLICLNRITLRLDQELLFVRFSFSDCPFRQNQFYGFRDYKCHVA